MTSSDMLIEAREDFMGLRSAARRIIGARGESGYEWWLKNEYDYPFMPTMPGYDAQFERAPLTRAEEQKIIDRRDKRLGRTRQSRLDEFVKRGK